MGGTPGQIHRDAVDVPINVPRHIRDWDGSHPRSRSAPSKLEESVADAAQRLRAARRPLLIGGVELFREKAERDFRRLAEKLEVAVLTSVLAKGVFPMDHPLHMGIYMGPYSHERIQERVRRADLVVALGTQPTDLNLGGAPPQIAAERSVWARSSRVEISHHQYTDVAIHDFVSALARQDLPSFGEKVVYSDNLRRDSPRKAKSGASARKQKALSINDLLLQVNEFLAQHGDYHVVAESGDMLFGGLEVRVHGKGLYLAQGYYASMGFAIPAAMGAEIGTGLRSLVICGDGGFQMTGPEIAHAQAKGLSPLVVLVNNAGWGIFRTVTKRQDLLALPNWPYAELAQAWGGVGFTARNADQLREALRAAHEVHGFALIECIVPERDLSPLGKRYIEGSARKASSG